MKELFSRILLIGIIFISFPAESATITGKVIGISDGDTITILDSDKRQHKIRLYGIDCPEGVSHSAMRQRSARLA